MSQVSVQFHHQHHLHFSIKNARASLCVRVAAASFFKFSLVTLWAAENLNFHWLRKGGLAF